MHEFLDLNSVVIVSAESVPNVEKVLAASQWGDEPIPATVVILDNDDEGKRQKAIITEPRKERTTESNIEQKKKRLLDPDFAVFIADLLTSEEGGQLVTTTEDIVPCEIFGRAVVAYVEQWFPELENGTLNKVQQKVSDPSFGSTGLVEATNKIMQELVHPDRKCYDKMGVFHEVVRIVNEAILNDDKADDNGKMAAAIESLKGRLTIVCSEIRRLIERAEQAQRRVTGKQAITRVVRDFLNQYKESAPVFDIELLFERLGREVELLGDDGTLLKMEVARTIDELQKMRSANQTRIESDEWERWREFLWSIRKNPFVAPDLSMVLGQHKLADSDSGESASSEENIEGEPPATRVDPPHDRNQSKTPKASTSAEIIDSPE